MLEYLYGKWFGWKIAWADRKEGDGLRAGQSTPTFLKHSHSSHLPAYEDGTDRASRNVGI